jgi:hypothetical protein
LKQLIRQNIFITMTPNVDTPSKNYLYKAGEECDYFVLLLEGMEFLFKFVLSFLLDSVSV